MLCKIDILLLLLVSIICLPTPKPQHKLKVFSTEKLLIKEGKSNSFNLKTKSEKDSDETHTDNFKFIANITEDETIEDFEINVTAKNLDENTYISYSYYVQVPKEEGKTLNKISHSCKIVQLSNDKVSKKECKSSFKEERDKYIFTYNSKLFNSDKLVIKCNYSKVRQIKEILFKTEYFSIPRIKNSGKCEFTFIIPKNYKSLGFKYNNFTNFKKKLDNIYLYNGKCPNESLEDFIRMSPKKTYWKTDVNYSIPSTEPFSRNISLTFLRIYKGGKNRNKNYKLTTNEDVVLNDSELINDEVYLKTELPGKNRKNVGVNLHTAFANNLNNDFIVLTSDKYYELNQNIDEVIKAKVDEILNDPNYKYKDYPPYYKLGKFVHNYINYNSSYAGKNLTALEIFNERHGVCEHYTLLYNTMLNKIGIKTLTIIGYGFENDTISANENTSGHAWTGALIDGKWKELDATWDLFEGISSAHIFKGFSKENIIYKGTNNKLKKSIKLQMIDNLDTEEENHTYIEPQIIYNKEEDKIDPDPEPNDTGTDIFWNPPIYAIKINISIYFYIFYLLFLF